MTIRYMNGRSFEAVLLSSTEATMRLAIQDSDDVLILNRVNGVWISEDCEPVDLSYSWNGGASASEVTVEDCICSHELAARLIRLLCAGENEPSGGAPPVNRTVEAPVFLQVV